MAEKPAVEDAPLNLVATGRYLLDRAILVLSAVSLPAGVGSCSLPTPSLFSFPRVTPST